MANFGDVLTQHGISFEENKPLHKYSTIKVGGPARFFVEVTTEADAQNVFKLVLTHAIPVFVLGGGSNVLISDLGFEGLVIKNNITEIAFVCTEQSEFVEQKARKQETVWKSNSELLSLDDINFTPSETFRLVKLGSGTGLPYALTYTINNDATGLQIFAGIPGTIGGALWNNIHGAKWLIGQFVKHITFVDATGTLQTKTPQELNFDYNYTDFHHQQTFILSALFTLFDGGKDHARSVANEWIARKKLQPKNSLGCIFSNISEQERLQAGLANLSAGYIIDKILGLKGLKIGGAQVSDSHSNFIVTQKGATAQDYLAVIEKIKQACFDQTGIMLKEEIAKVGKFD